MAAIRIKARAQTQEQKVERFRAASQRARLKLANQAGESGDEDFAHWPLSKWRAQWHDKAIRRLFIENFIYVRDAFDENKLTLLKFNDLQADAHDREDAARKRGIKKFARIKGRRAGSSKLAQAKTFANAVVLSGRRVRASPHDPDTEAEFRADYKIMYENLPAHLQPKTRHYSDELIWFHDPAKGTVDSWIKTSTPQPGREGKGRGLGITDLWMSEAAHYLGDQRKAAIALIEAATGGEVTVDTTPYGIEWVFGVYEQGKKDEGGWSSQKYEWWWTRHYRIRNARFTKARGKWILLKPGESVRDVWKILPAGASEEARAINRARFDAAVFTLHDDQRKETDEYKAATLILAHLKALGYVGKRAKWNCDEVAEYIAWRRAKIQDIGEADFKVEYLENDVDCFENSGRPVVSPAHLKEPCESSQPMQGHRYVVGVDSSMGYSTGNPGGVVVLDLDTGRMAHAERLRMSPDQLAYRAGELSDLYNGALIVPERNNTGVTLISALCDLGYGESDRLYRHLDEALKRKVEDQKLTIDEAFEQAKLGFPTTFQGAASKSNAAMMLEESIRKEWLGVLPLFIEEARTIVWFDNETFGPLPGQDHHGDVFMATLIANYYLRTMAAMGSGFIDVLPEIGDAR